MLRCPLCMNLGPWTFVPLIRGIAFSHACPICLVEPHFPLLILDCGHWMCAEHWSQVPEEPLPTVSTPAPLVPKAAPPSLPAPTPAVAQAAPPPLPASAVSRREPLPVASTPASVDAKAAPPPLPSPTPAVAKAAPPPLPASAVSSRGPLAVSDEALSAKKIPKGHPTYPQNRPKMAPKVGLGDPQKSQKSEEAPRVVFFSKFLTFLGGPGVPKWSPKRQKVRSDFSCVFRYAFWDVILVNQGVK